MNISEFSQNEHKFIMVQNDANLEIIFCNYGASVYSVKYKNKIVTYHPLAIVDFLNSDKFCGKILGRTCGRIKDGRINVNGKDYLLEVNEKGNTLHGGFNNLSFKDFALSTKDNGDSVDIIFNYVSPELECGFPASVNFTITYQINKTKDEFSILLNAVPSATTPINMSTHIYWRLSEEDILNHELTINADERTKSNIANLVTIDREKVNKIFDFRNGKKIGQDIFELAKKEPVAHGYDHGLIFAANEKPTMILKSKNIKLTVTTDMSMVNVYTNCGFNKDLMMNEYGPDKLYGGVALEPQMFFKSYQDILISPDQPFNHYITFLLESVNE